MSQITTRAHVLNKFAFSFEISNLKKITITTTRFPNPNGALINL